MIVGGVIGGWLFAKLGVTFSDAGYFTKMHALYENAKVTQGFYSAADHLWWRDATFEPPFKTPNGKQCYWSRGNGWVFAALTRALDITPANAPYRAEYTADLQAMAGALISQCRSLRCRGNALSARIFTTPFAALRRANGSFEPVGSRPSPNMPATSALASSRPL